MNTPAVEGSVTSCAVLPADAGPLSCVVVSDWGRKSGHGSLMSPDPAVSSEPSITGSRDATTRALVSVARCRCPVDLGKPRPPFYGPVYEK
jgi:hypothetical protein